MKYELTCINCPMGCRITADYDGKEVTNIQGFTCARGKAMVTALVGVKGTHVPLSVKTQTPIRKPLIFDALSEIRKTVVVPPVHIGDVVISDVCGSGVNVIATENIE